MIYQRHLPGGASADPLGRVWSLWATLGPSRSLCQREPLSLPCEGLLPLRCCSPALLSIVCLLLPAFPQIPFLACDLACLVCTVQIKVVSINVILMMS